MMKFLSMMILSLTVSGVAMASVNETKATNSSNDKINQAAGSVSKACGGKIAASIDWSKYDSLQYGSTKKEDALRWAGDYGSIALKALIDLCKDKDYKSAVSQITQYVAVADAPDQTVTVSKNGNTITEHFNAFKSSTANIEKKVKELF
jgi:hypothetical protein